MTAEVERGQGHEVVRTQGHLEVFLSQEKREYNTFLFSVLISEYGSSVRATSIYNTFYVADLDISTM